MKHACEIIAKDILPALRALLAKSLIENHNLTQREAARRLGMTQPAMSQYTNKLRGYRGKVLKESNEVSEWVNKISETVSQKEEPLEIEKKLCSICRKIREEGILEDKYGITDPKIC